MILQVDNRCLDEVEHTFVRVEAPVIRNQELTRSAPGDFRCLRSDTGGGAIDLANVDSVVGDRDACRIVALLEQGPCGRGRDRDYPRCAESNAPEAQCAKQSIACAALESPQVPYDGSAREPAQQSRGRSTKRVHIKHHRLPCPYDP